MAPPALSIPPSGGVLRRQVAPYADEGAAALPRQASTDSAKRIPESPTAPLVVVKVGTSTLMTSDERGQRVQLGNVAQLVEVVARLKSEGYRVVVVSSGAVGMGLIKLGLTEKPKSLSKKQAVAAAGQSQLMRMYEDLFGTVRVHVAQVLISQSDFMDRVHWDNIKQTILECLELGVVPIINENDSTSTEELRFGDNDHLSALTAVQLEADWLFIFTDVDYLYTANPREDPTAAPLRVVREVWAQTFDTGGTGTDWGTGGMATKLSAARTTASAGIYCGLLHGAHPERISTFLRFDPEHYDEEGDVFPESLPEGTLFLAMPTSQTVNDQRRWILSLPSGGDIVLDEGAKNAVLDRKSLLPAGIKEVTGTFVRGDAVRILAENGDQLARATVNFSAEELDKIKGHRSSQFKDVLGYECAPEAAYRGNIILTQSDPAAPVQRGLSGTLLSLMGRPASISDVSASDDHFS